MSSTLLSKHMAIVKKSDTQATERTIIGKAWVNVVKKADSKVAGQSFIQVSLDRDIETVTLKQGEKLQLWPNKKREGKTTDADYSVSIVSALEA